MYLSAESAFVIPFTAQIRQRMLRGMNHTISLRMANPAMACNTPVKNIENASLRVILEDVLLFVYVYVCLSESLSLVFDDDEDEACLKNSQKGSPDEE